MKRQFAVCLLSAALACGTAMTAYAGSWQKSGSSWTYVEDSGRQATNTSKKGADDQWRWINGQGVMATNSWADEDYYVDGDGKLVTNKWLKLAKRDDERSGALCWYYFGNSGKCVTDGWAKINGKYYYFNSDGEMQTGWVDSDEYYLGDDGAMKTGWAYVMDPKDDDDDDDGPSVSSPGDDEDTHWYYFESSGKKYEPGSTTNGYGLKKIDGTTYCFDDDGAMQTGWVYLGDNGKSFKSYRYFQDNGAVMKKWAKLTPPDGDDENDDLGLDYGTDEQWYYFDKNGVPYVGPDGNDASTSDLEKISGITYLFNEKGNPVYGLRKLHVGSSGEEACYYFGADQATSSVQSGEMEVEEADGTKWDYYFSTSGNKGRGYTGVHDNKLYYLGKLQEAKDDSYRIITVSGHDYIVNRSGKIQKNDSIKIGGTKYKTGSSGYVISVDGTNGDAGDAAEDPDEPNYWDND